MKSNLFENKIKSISLFSGIGAYEKALTNLGIEVEVLNYCEINKYAATGYSAIHNVSEDKNLGDISKVDLTTLPKCDLVTYSFPCQSISAAGRKEGIIRGKTKSGLVYEALEVIETTQPKVAVMENVKNLVGKEFINDFQNLLMILEEMGYNNYWEVMNSVDYGIPQNRTRVILVSIKKEYDHGFVFPNKIPLTRKVIDFIEKDDINVKWVTGEEDPVTYRYLIEKGFEKIEGAAKNPSTREYHGFKEITDCLLAHDAKTKNLVQFKNNDGKYVIRRMTPLESIKLMGFDREDYFKIKKSLEDKYYKGREKSDTQVYTMAGNSVVVQVLEGVFRQLYLKQEEKN